MGSRKEQRGRDMCAGWDEAHRDGRARAAANGAAQARAGGLATETGVILLGCFGGSVPRLLTDELLSHQTSAHQQFPSKKGVLFSFVFHLGVSFCHF